MAALLRLVLGSWVFAASVACNSSGDATPARDTSGFCQASAVAANACGEDKDPCLDAQLRDCAKIGAAYSDAYMAAAEACASDTRCRDGGAGEFATCTDKRIERAAPSAAQTQLAQHYCARCAPDSPTCVADFYVGDDAGREGTGVPFRAFSDAIIGKIDGDCVPLLVGDASPAGCEVDLLNCAFPIIDDNVYVPPECLSQRRSVP